MLAPGKDAFMEWHDVSIPLRTGMAVWPGDPSFVFEADGRIARGDGCNTSVLRMATHTGTHCDAPWHFEDEGKKLDAVDPSVFFGKALLISIPPDVPQVCARHLPSEPLPPRVLFRTRNADIPLDAPFQEDFAALEVDAAERLVADGVRLVGIDYLSIAPKGNSGPTHHTLLRNDVFVVEGLRLGAFGPGEYEFVVLPLPIQGADGAPCRAFIGTKD